MSHLSGNDLVKGGVIIAVVWWIWFSYNHESSDRNTRASLLVTLAGAFGAVILARMMALVLPFRFRPIHDPDYFFLLPYGTAERTLDGWSSFPSDHAALFFGLATGLLLISRRRALVGFCYVFIVIIIPRMYIGLHYPTDMIAGAILGILCVSLANLPIIRGPVTKPILLWSERHGPSFYAFFFVLTFQVATLFEGIRNFAGFMVEDLLRLRG
jgi:undecaprenyl-diphosphatase